MPSNGSSRDNENLEFHLMSDMSSSSSSSLFDQNAPSSPPPFPGLFSASSIRIRWTRESQSSQSLPTSALWKYLLAHNYETTISNGWIGVADSHINIWKNNNIPIPTLHFCIAPSSSTSVSISCNPSPSSPSSSSPSINILFSRPDTSVSIDLFLSPASSPQDLYDKLQSEQKQRPHGMHESGLISSRRNLDSTPVFSFAMKVLGLHPRGPFPRLFIFIWASLLAFNIIITMANWDISIQHVGLLPVILSTYYPTYLMVCYLALVRYMRGPFALDNALRSFSINDASFYLFKRSVETCSIICTIMGIVLTALFMSEYATQTDFAYRYDLSGFTLYLVFFFWGCPTLVVLFILTIIFFAECLMHAYSARSSLEPILSPSPSSAFGSEWPSLQAFSWRLLRLSSNLHTMSQRFQVPLLLWALFMLLAISAVAVAFDFSSVSFVTIAFYISALIIAGVPIAFCNLEVDRLNQRLQVAIFVMPKPANMSEDLHDTKSIQLSSTSAALFQRFDIGIKIAGIRCSPSLMTRLFYLFATVTIALIGFLNKNK